MFNFTPHAASSSSRSAIIVFAPLEGSGGGYSKKVLSGETPPFLPFFYIIFDRKAPLPYTYYSQTSLIRDTKGRNQVSALQRCPYYRGRQCMIFGISGTKQTVCNGEVSVLCTYQLKPRPPPPPPPGPTWGFDLTSLLILM